MHIKCDSDHTHLTALLPGTTRVSWYQKGKTNLDFAEATDSEWQWHQLGHMQVCTLLSTDNHASTPPLSFLQVECPSCCPTNSVKAMKAIGSGISRGINRLTMQCISRVPAVSQCKLLSGNNAVIRKYASHVTRHLLPGHLPPPPKTTVAYTCLWSAPRDG